MTTTPEQIEAVARMRLMIQSHVEDDARAWELTDDELAVIAEVAINAMRPLIRAEALEEAAKVADQMQDLHPMDDFDTGWTAGLHECSAAIRALKDMKIGDYDGTLECVAAALRGRSAAIRALKEKP